MARTAASSAGDSPQSPARPHACVEGIGRHPVRFARGVLAAFKRNQGLLLSGAVAYYMLSKGVLYLLGAQVIAEFERCTLAGSGEDLSGFTT